MEKKLQLIDVEALDITITVEDAKILINLAFTIVVT
jgi:hypothetical protein